MSTRKVAIELCGKEELTHSAPVVIEVPADASDVEIKELFGHDIEQLLVEVDGEIEWNLDYSGGIVADDTIFIGDSAETTSPDLSFVRDATGQLVCVNNGEAPHMAEAFDVLVERIKADQPVPTEIELELEDDNSITWDTSSLVEAAKGCAFSLSALGCKSLGLPEGSRYADAALLIEARLKEDRE